MKRVLSLLTVIGLIIGFTSCRSDVEGNQAGKPAFMQKNDSISKQPAMGDTANTGS